MEQLADKLRAEALTEALLALLEHPIMRLLGRLGRR
jgi:hypothetical protein